MSVHQTNILNSGSHSPLMTTYRPPVVRRTDWINPLVMLSLAVIGVLFIKSAERFSGGSEWEQQLIWLTVGATFYITLASLDYHIWMKYAWLVYLGSIVLLLLLWSGLGQVRGGSQVGSGARRWLGFGSYTIQPSEFAKIGTIIMLSFVLAKSSLGSFRDSLAMLSKIAVLLAIPMMLIFLQPDLGSSLVLFPTVFALLYVSNLSARFFVTVFGLFLLGIFILNLDIKHYEDFLLTKQKITTQLTQVEPSSIQKFISFQQTTPSKLQTIENYRDFLKVNQLSAQDMQIFNFLHDQHFSLQQIQGKYEKLSWLPLKDYQRDRIASFLEPDVVDPQGIGVAWNQKQSLIAVATGGLSGKGYENGTQARLGYLPHRVATSDFIMAVFLEETGFIGGLAVIGLYAILLSNTLRIAWLARDRFGQLLCVGVAVLFMVHVFVNIGMVQGLMPVKGIPLPLMSYGGSFVLSCCILMGLVQSVYRNCREAV